MPSSPPPAKNTSTATKVNLGEFIERYRGESSALNSRFRYYAAALPFGEEEVREYFQEPMEALPPALLEGLPQVFILLAPYLEKPERQGNGKRAVFDPREAMVLMDPPEEDRRLSFAYLPGEPATLVFGVKELEVSDYHYNFYYALGRLACDYLPEDGLAGYSELLREELKARVHGEVDEPSWHAKQALLQKQSGTRGETKLFRDYARQSFIDTLTLYLHGICCDIDVEPGPRQIASRYIRKRLVYLQSKYPAPEGFAVFPEELKN